MMIKDIDALLQVLETEPSGPVELDQSLLYDEPLFSDREGRGDDDRPGKDTISSFHKTLVCRKDNSSLGSLEESLPTKRSSGNHKSLVSGNVCSPESARGRGDTGGTRIEETEEFKIGCKYDVPVNVRQVQEASLPGHVERRERRLDELRKELNEREMNECTFKPAIRKKCFASFCVERGRMPVEERLLCGAGRQREDDVRRWKRELEVVFQKECSFAPHTKIDEVKKKMLEQDECGLPLYKRAGQVLRSKDQLMEELEKKVATGLTFTPNIREMSKRIAEKKRRKEAMMKELGRVERKDAIPSDAILGTQQDEYLSKHSKAILSKAINVPADFYQRQKHFIQVQDEKIKGAIQGRKQSDREKAHFAAQTPVEVLISSERLVNQMLERPQERWSRMSSGDADIIKKRKDNFKRQADPQQEFQPKLNPASLRIASRGRSKQVHSRKRPGIEEYNEEKYRECTFVPDTSKPSIMGYYEPYDRPIGKAQLSVSIAVKSNRFNTFMKQIEEHKRTRAKKAEELKQARQEKELKECTFRPNLQSTRDCEIQKMKNAEFDKLPGVDIFMERRLLAQRQKEEKEEREAHVFKRFTNQWRNCPTVVQPFNLSCYQSS